MLEFDLSELHDVRGGYITVRATDEQGRSVSVTTNKYGEGLFRVYETPCGIEYHQTKGTYQFKLPAREQGASNRRAGPQAI